MRFRVHTKEVHIQILEVEADNAQEALEKVVDGEGTISSEDVTILRPDLSLEYERTMDPDEGWMVEGERHCFTCEWDCNTQKYVVIPIRRDHGRTRI